MSEFINKIRVFQSSDDKRIIQDILEKFDTNFMEDPSRHRVKDGTPSGGIRINLKDPESYIAYSIKAIYTLILRHIKSEKPITKNETDSFNRFLSILKYDVCIDFEANVESGGDSYVSYFEITESLFLQLEPLLDEILLRLEEFCSLSDRLYFEELYNKHKQVTADIEPQKEQLKKEILEIAEKAIEYALVRVDTSRSEREIVKYINRAIRSKLIDAEIKRNGMRRIRRKINGDLESFSLKPYFPDDEYLIETILGLDFSDCRDQLTKGENEFIDQILEVVKEDKEVGNVAPYTCNIYGEIRIIKKYIAEKLDVSHEVVRKRLSRIRKKVTK
ncbi:hypothetical protein P5609_019910 [Bacillus licheniformis]|uniref:hypothetical protein n=1 Tax=Bacillus licheniformis TaxID=1402 RepID=UPI00018C9235|nr:hypothetical protein [Bacillus licheniformis]MDH3161761.1 hypothetical protein [Bacillus licheniformis]MED4305616.1 hypothetical protein [Bacillus licheniformis]MED4410989.1 hypothetical protein [Bacillus licheniformis]QDL77729.1 hypothetical protein D9Y32_09930 [Bacillus licheniformis]